MNWLTDSIREFIHRGDRLLLTLCLLASGFGMVLIYSATRYMNHSAGLRCMLIQAVGIVLGVFVYIAMSSVDIELFLEMALSVWTVHQFAAPDPTGDRRG